MNPLLIFFFLSLFLEDFIFKQGKLFYLFISFVIAYWIFYSFQKSGPAHTPYRKMLMAEFSQSSDPTVYAKLKIDTKKGKQFLNDLETKLGKKISWTLFFTKCCAEAFKKYPHMTHKIKFGSLHESNSFDFCILVDNLAFITLKDCANKSFSQLADDLYPHAKNIKAEKDEKIKSELNLLTNLPSFLISLFAETLGFLSNLGLKFKALAIEPYKFGSIMVTSLGGFKLNNAFAPLSPFAYCSSCISICSSKIKKILNKDGTVTESEILPINIALDHRFIDGFIGAKILKELKEYLLNPEKIEII